MSQATPACETTTAVSSAAGCVPGAAGCMGHSRSGMDPGIVPQQFRMASKEDI